MDWEPNHRSPHPVQPERIQRRRPAADRRRCALTGHLTTQPGSHDCYGSLEWWSHNRSEHGCGHRVYIDPKEITQIGSTTNFNGTPGVQHRCTGRSSPVMAPPAAAPPPRRQPAYSRPRRWAWEEGSSTHPQIPPPPPPASNTPLNHWLRNNDYQRSWYGGVQLHGLPPKHGRGSPPETRSGI